MQHSFDVDIAKEYGILEAILLNHLWFWIKKNEANDTNYYDDNYWTYNSTRAFNELFPYVSQRQIQNALTRLKNEEIIITGNYNNSAYDRTLWYAFSKKGKCIMQKCKMEDVKKGNGLVENVKPIPDNNTNINKDNIYIKEKNIKKEKLELLRGQEEDKCPPKIEIELKDKDKIKDKERKRFIKPTLEEVEEYCKERNNNIDAERFIDFYESKGWKVGSSPMKDWKACIRTWEKKNVKKETIPDWFDKKAKEEELTKDEEKVLDELGLKEVIRKTIVDNSSMLLNTKEEIIKESIENTNKLIEEQVRPIARKKPKKESKGE